MRSLLLFLAFLSVPAEAGITVPVREAPSLPSQTGREHEPRCSSIFGITDGAMAYQYRQLLAAKAATLSTDMMKGYGDVTITVTRTGRRITTLVDGKSELVYDPTKDEISPVFATLSTWAHPVCPRLRQDLLMLAMLERLYAAYPAEGQRVTSPTTDPALEPDRAMTPAATNPAVREESIGLSKG